MGLDRFYPELSQVGMQLAYAIQNVLIRLCLNQGMNRLVFLTYKHLIAAIAIAPVAQFRERKNRSQMTPDVFFHIFFLAFCGVTVNQNFYYAAMTYASSTYAAAMANLLPACAFVMAVALGLEEMNLRAMKGRVKVVGTLACVGGAMVMTFYKGAKLSVLNAALNMASEAGDRRVIASALVLASEVFWAIWLISQSYLIKKYPAHFSMTCIMCVCAAVQCAVIAFIEGVPASSWAVAWNQEFFVAVYSGVVCSAISLIVQSWCIEKRGPVFVAVFNPLTAIYVAIIETCILHYVLHLGSVIGAAIIMIGLYMVLWGKKDGQNGSLLGELKEEEDEQIAKIPQGGNRDCLIDVNVRRPLLQK